MHLARKPAITKCHRPETIRLNNKHGGLLYQIIKSLAGCGCTATGKIILKEIKPKELTHDKQKWEKMQ